MNPADRPSTSQRAAAYAAWRQRLSQQVDETKVIDLVDRGEPTVADEPTLDWSTTALFAESRLVAEREQSGSGAGADRVGGDRVGVDPGSENLTW